MRSALAQVTSDPNVNFDTVAIMAPYFANGDDKNTGFPWTNGLGAGLGSTSNALVWKGSQWSAGGNNQYPDSSKTTSSYTVLDQIIQYFDNPTLFPKLNQIVIAGHSLGAQTVQRYAALGNQLNTRTPVSYWIGNPNSYVWLSTDRPLPTGSCSTYDDYREGYNKFTDYPMTYGKSLVASGRAAILSNFNAKAINYARGTQDLGDDSSTCAPGTTGKDRNERFFNFIKAFPPSCSNPAGRNCDTVDFVNMGHDGGGMMASPAGQARLFLDNFYGNGSRAYDFGYPRQQAGDDPFPNPSLNTTSSSINNNTYAGNMTYWGCWSDQTQRTLTNMTYQSDANTIELCTQTCADGGNTIAGLEATNQCYCGTSLGYQAQQVVDSSCQYSCPGNSSQICGGYNRLSLFSSGRPKVLAAPSTPETVGDFYYASCYTEGANNARALTGKSTQGNFMTLDYCANFCSGYRYFGAEYGRECYCGNGFSNSPNRTADNDCSYLCANDSTQFCGAGNRLTVYQNPSWVAPSSVSTTTAATATSPGSPQSTGVSCPASNNAIVTSGGKNFTTECGVDHYAGDLTSLNVNSFQHCIDACAQNSQCVDVSLYGTACYMKSNVGAAIANDQIWGAKLQVSGSTSSASTTIGSSTTSTTASASNTAVVCPAADNTTIVSNGASFLVECGIDRAGGDMKSLGVSSFQQCIDACATTPGCVDVSLSGSACYLKSTLAAAVNNGGIWGAKLVTTSTSSSTSGSASSSSTSSTTGSGVTSSSVSPPSSSATPVTCPSSDGTTVTSNGVSFLVECGIDHAGGDMKSLGVSSFRQCIDACATTPGCVDVALSGSACYLKSQLGAAVNNGVWGAKVVTAPTSSSSGSVSSTSSSTSTSTASSSTTTSSEASSDSATSSSTATQPSATSSSTASTFSTITTTSSSITSTSSIQTSTSTSQAQALPSGFVSVGCFVDSNVRVLPKSRGSSNAQTPQQCAMDCQAQGYKYSGTEWSQECWCGNAAPKSSVAAPWSDCNMACKGDKTQKCGDSNRISVVQDTTWQQTFFARQSYNTWNLMSCYVDSGSSRTLSRGVSLSAFGGASNATISNCLDACAASGYTYCGEEYYSECYGSMTAPTANVAAGDDPLSAGCNYPCNGNKTEACGGSNRILVYINNGTSA